MDNKNIFASNLRRYMEARGKSRKEVSEAIGVSYFTFSDWVNGKKYPRMDKIERLADYFGILKSDLIESKSEEHKEMQKKNDIQTDVVLRMRSDAEFAEAVNNLYVLDSEKFASIKQLLATLAH